MLKFEHSSLYALGHGDEIFIIFLNFVLHNFIKKAAKYHNLSKNIFRGNTILIN